MGCFLTKQQQEIVELEQKEFQNESDVPFWVRVQERERILEHNQTIFEEIRRKGEEQMVECKRNSEMNLKKREEYFEEKKYYIEEQMLKRTRKLKAKEDLR